MSLVESGELTLDQPVRTVLGDDLPEIDDRTTIEHLLAHRSGIGDYLDESEPTDINDYLQSAITGLVIVIAVLPPALARLRASR